ncbi:hypothetical protein ACW73L_22105 [Methylolobus aquaticus]
MASIPVELFNPGQVFACMGFLEAAEALCGVAEGCFVWKDEPRFLLQAEGEQNPIEVILSFLAEAEAKAVAPADWQPAKGDRASLETIDFFPARTPNPMSLPIKLQGGGAELFVGHWSDGTDGREAFKLYAGNRSALKIATDMLKGTGDRDGKAKTVGITVSAPQTPGYAVRIRW